MLVHLVEQFGYLAIAGLLVGGGVGLPVPEELIQLTAGYLARVGYLQLVPALLACYAGIVTGDFLLFTLARRHGESLLAKVRAGRVLTPSRRARLERHFDRHAFLTIVVARHTSGLRIGAYVLAAVHGVRPRTFLLADALSAAASVPLVVGAGYLFAEHLDEVKRRVHEVQGLLLVVVGLGLAAWVLVRWRRRRRREALARIARAIGGAGAPGARPAPEPLAAPQGDSERAR